ncbi:MAG TPA: hypothetical protein VH853_25745 [Polyangia bacterium]|jgi:hypothetical protein|nr:hypothetical protein [Polyangia bacterium]
MPIRHAPLILLVILVGVGWAIPSRADSPAPTCAAYQSLVTCDASDVGKACTGGGQCESLFCRGDASMTIYKCMTGADAGKPVDSTSTAGGGCDVAARATGPGAIALGLLLIGTAALLFERRRKARR